MNSAEGEQKMRKIVSLAVFLTFVLLGIRSEAKIYFKDTLIINGGEDSIEMAPGEKLRLDVREGFWEYPIFDGLRFLSTDKSVAWVDKRGLVHAMLPGEAEILVMDERGRNSNITVKVVQKNKATGGQMIGVSVCLLCVIVFFSYKKISLF